MIVTDVNDVNYAIKQNRQVIDQYIQARITEVNLEESTQKTVRDNLNRFSKFVKKCFNDVNRDEYISFLNLLRKSDTQDPTQKWIGTYNHSRMLINTFFKWLYYPNMDPGKRPKPDVILNISQLKRKEKSTYKPSDLWTQEDDMLFLKHCPSKRDKCYHMMARDLSNRPSEVLKLKIKDVVFKMAADGRQYAE